MWFKSSFTAPAVAAIGLCLIGGTTPAYADFGDQLAKLLADDGHPNHQFGVSVAISGTTAIVGANRDDDNAVNAGSAYVFDISDAANPTQLFELLPNDGAAFDAFGFSVAIGGSTTIVGAVWDDDNGTDSGSAYLFDITTGQQIFKLLPNDGAAEDWFGTSVAISGPSGNEFVIAGAIFDDDNETDSGSAYIFDANTGLQVAKLLPDDGGSGDLFGNSIAISGSTAIVGAVGDNDDGLDSGSAYLFDVTDPNNPTQLAKAPGQRWRGGRPLRRLRCDQLQHGHRRGLPRRRQRPRLRLGVPV